VNAAGRIWKWSAKYPNARLAALGVILIYGPAGIAKGIEGIGWLVFRYLTEPVRTPNWEIYWNIFVWSFWVFGVVVVFPLMLAGATIIPFAAYRAIRDFFARRRFARLNRS
jgi:hypothetical protein